MHVTTIYSLKTWHDISLNFVKALCTSSCFGMSLLSVDYFSIYGHFLYLKHPFTPKEIEKIFTKGMEALNQSSLEYFLISHRVEMAKRRLLTRPRELSKILGITASLIHG